MENISLSVIASTGSRHKMKTIFMMERLCWVQKRRLFLPEFSNCIDNSSSVAIMRAERKQIQRKREREREKKEAEKRGSKEDANRNPKRVGPRPPSIFKIPFPLLQEPGPKCLSWRMRPCLRWVLFLGLICGGVSQWLPLFWDCKLDGVCFCPAYLWWLWSWLCRICVGSVGSVAWCLSDAIVPFV